jgi:hyperpolarization activated cyclic nucleotide-gated potassium channel 2
MRLLRLAKLKLIFEKIEELIQLSTPIAAIISFLKLSLFLLFWSHWLGCIFHFVAINEDEESIKLPNNVSKLAEIEWDF